MRTGLRLVAATIALAGVAALPAPASAAPGELSGTWTSVDLDGSNQTLKVSGSGNPTYAVVLRDDETSGVCGGAPAQLVGPGSVDGDELVVLGRLVCVPGGNPLSGGPILFTFEHDAATDTLTDFTGVVWHRAD